MFHSKNVHGLVKGFHIIPTGMLGAFAFVMNDGLAPQVMVSPAITLYAVGQIDVLAIHEK